MDTAPSGSLDQRHPHAGGELVSSPALAIEPIRSRATASAIVALVALLGAIAVQRWGATTGLAGWGHRVLAALGATAFSRWVNESEGVIGYAGILFLHTFGLAIVVGSSVVICLRILGVAGRIPLRSLTSLFAYLWVGFWVNAVSGIVLFVADGPKKAANSVFETKLVLVALGVLAMTSIDYQLTIEGTRRTAATARLRWLAVGALAAWLAATAAGRLIAYHALLGL